MQAEVDYNEPNNQILLLIQFYLTSVKNRKLSISEQYQVDRLNKIFDIIVQDEDYNLSHAQLRDVLACCYYDLEDIKGGVKSARELDRYHQLKDNDFYNHGLKAIGSIGHFAITAIRALTTPFINTMSIENKEKVSKIKEQNNNRIQLQELINL